ncbi:MAG: hypothetical protein K2W97_01720 [Chthoniobacterales bacterium]|nr:hypothetical protein [Chthoniobacterales bacterium]
MNSLSSPSLSRTYSFVEPSQEELSAATQNSLQKFQDVARGNPEADRLIMSKDGLDITPAPRPFYGIPLQFIFGKSQTEVSENKAILEQFQEALLTRYGARVTSFACPTLGSRITQGSRLNAATVQQVLKDADLFENILKECDRVIQEAVVTDAAATLACAEFNKTASDYDKQYAKAKQVVALSESKRNQVNQFIDDYISRQNLPPESPERQALQQLKTLWRAAKQEPGEGSGDDLALFEAIANEGEDRYILNKEATQVVAAPRMLTGWTGAAFQVVVGRDTTSTQENRRTIDALHRALDKKYGHAIANFAFPTALARKERGSRLDAKTIQETLQRARQASELLNDPQITPLINDAITTSQDARIGEHRYRQATIARQEAGKDKDIKLAAAHEAYAHAEKTILDHLADHAIDRNITINHSSRFLHLWFDEARARFSKTQASPSAPPANDSDSFGDRASRSRQPSVVIPATNPNHRPEEDNVDDIQSAVAIPSAPPFSAIPIAEVVNGNGKF